MIQIFENTFMTKEAQDIPVGDYFTTCAFGDINFDIYLVTRDCNDPPETDMIEVVSLNSGKKQLFNFYYTVYPVDLKVNFSLKILDS